MSSYHGLRRSDFSGGGGGGATTATYAAPPNARHRYASSDVASSLPVHGFAAPPKGYFAAALPGGGPADDLPPATSPSLVPVKGRRRESLTGQMRRKVSESTTAAAAGGGGSALSLSRQSSATGAVGIPKARSPSAAAAAVARGMSTSPRMGPTGYGADGSLSASFGAAAEALSLSSSMTSTAAQPRSFSAGFKQERSLGHQHFGRECYGPGSDAMSPPSAGLSMLSSSAGGLLDGSHLENEKAGLHARRSSISSNATEDDDAGAGRNGMNGKFVGGTPLSHQNSQQLLHKCESCAKVYRHPSCLVKHRWEHTVYWKEASKFLMSKHQQVQLLEAAAILVGMDSNSRSLPDEKALWPAAVSPPSSGLLGSDVVNFEKLKAMKTRNQTPTASSTGRSGTADSSRSSRSPAEDAMRMTRGSTMSPLNSLSQLQLDRRQSVSTENADVQALHLDGSDATTSDPADRSGSVETEDDLPDEEDMTDIERDRYGLGAGGDVLASLEMDGVE